MATLRYAIGSVRGNNSNGLTLTLSWSAFAGHDKIA